MLLFFCLLENKKAPKIATTFINKIIIINLLVVILIFSKKIPANRIQSEHRYCKENVKNRFKFDSLLILLRLPEVLSTLLK
jgi:hypothetical protein